MKLRSFALAAAAFSAVIATPLASRADDNSQDRIRAVVDAAVRPLMAKDDISGMAVGITIDGKHRVFNYGIASKETRRPVTDNTLFELGSITKTFTATLACWAEVNNRLSLSDPVGKYLPSLEGSPFGKLKLIYLGTHTPGGMPLQVPDEIQNEEQLMRYLKAWRPAYAPGTYRTYTNPGIGVLGLIVAKNLRQDPVALVEKRLFPALGMKSSYIDVPPASMADYAQGYSKQNAPIRMSPGMLAQETYGLTSTAVDLLRFLDANLALVKLDPQLERAIANTHTGYFQAGAMTQDLIWEQYPYPVALKTLLAGNSPAMIFDANPVTEFKPPQAPRKDVWVNKTGSTNGFGAYVAFVPERRLGIAILANKNFPIEERVALAYKIASALVEKTTPASR